MIQVLVLGLRIRVATSKSPPTPSLSACYASSLPNAVQMQILYLLLVQRCRTSSTPLCLPVTTKHLFLALNLALTLTKFGINCLRLASQAYSYSQYITLPVRLPEDTFLKTRYLTLTLTQVARCPQMGLWCPLIGVRILHTSTLKLEP